ncbi:Auracyanin-A [Durusdinium trenchii]|uniref:Auracyanin-A n=1 Tax=Durusdinium trenchii TaxID=1381693 RepID=A0ABP0HNF6_9DINO
MTFEPGRIRLFVDGKQVASEHVTRTGNRPVPGGLGLGRLVEGTLNHHGQIDWVRLSDGIRPISEAQLDVPVVDERTVGLWTLKEGSFVAAPVTRQERPAASAALAPSTPRYDAKFVAEIARDALEKGDPVRGAAIFSNAKSACLSCHRVGTHGGTVGPELSKIGTEKKIAHLVESLFWPKREVKPEFKTWQVVTTEGQVLRGYRVKSADDVLVLRDPASGALTQVPMEEVEAVQEGSTLMPDQLTAAMSRQQQLDLIRFLTSLGKLDEAQRERINRTFAHASVHGPATFPYEREPIHPEQWPNADHPVNRDRLYDFYTKQAEYFRAQDPAPMLLSEFPGLDGGEQGHWGNQNEQSWADGRWNDTILGSVQCGIFRGAGVTVPRGVCVQLGETGEFATCFNPETLQYEVVWQGGFVSFSDVRHGFMHGIRMEGEVVSHPEKTSISQPFEYRGFYRYGRQVVFAYRIGDTEYLDAPSFVNGTCSRGGDSQWPQQLTTPITPGTGRPYAVDTIELPYDNPWKALLFCGGHDFLPDGSVLICTMQGDVWHVSGLDADPNKPGRAVWRRFASGLHHALGLVVDNGEIFVMGRDQLTRLHDLNGDGEADYYECFSNAFETSAAGHDFICGLQRDKRGRFYTASGNEGIVRISADGKRTEILATGFRTPDGLGLLPDGTITVPCSEGSWTPASMICAVPGQKASAPPFYGYGGPRNGKPPALPLVYIPRGLDNSSGGQVYVESDRWGPTEGQLVHLSFGSGTHFLVLQDVVAGQRQGALVPLPGDFRSGVHRGRFHPLDGQLYVSGMAGWGSYTADDGCFQRVRYTGPKAQLPQSFHVHENGVTVTFSQPLDRNIAENPASHFAQCWNYRYSEAYGSPEYSTTHPGVRGHDPLLIRSAHVLDDGRTLFLEIPDLQPVNQLHLRLHVDEGAMSPRGGHDLFATVHRLDQPFTDFESYRPEPKVIAVHPLLADLAANAQRVPNPFKKRIKDARKITIETGKNLTFATRRLTVRPGEAIEFTLRNPDVVPHNWALVKPGTLPTVGEMANRLISDPEAVSRHYIPTTDDVLVYTDVVPAGNTFTIYFKAPATPGEYPYLCTFPGHWMVMNGTLVVE